MSSEEFEKLHDMYKALYDELKLISDRVICSQGEEKKKQVRVFDERHGEAQELLQEMEQELLSAPSSFRSAMSSKVRLYHRDLGKLQRQVHTTDTGFGFSVRMGDAGHGIYAAQNERSTEQQAQRALLIQGSESLNNATQSITRSHHIAVESEQIGTDIIEELGQQREQLDRTRDRLVHTGENLSRSRKILRTMSRRLITNKLLLGIIIVMELAILGGVVYLKFFRH
ncbi:vesicle transport through interaction with t-SNAREs homolog 1B [Neoarius graeffei]|uniref:vesicle transport through interaction with t-SNAREs homolog 1B n=1 Tax=Neoarius graeffei TaxID=443677 RepID=UPI00298CC711|nr:vesicle transport through interaction with t-SNAREs homolog 1B [Neoarius graeffei]